MPLRNFPGSLLTSLMLSLALLGGCVNLAPDYHRPDAPVAGQWPTITPHSMANAADIGWRQFFIDSRLKQIVELALSNNRDLRVAALNIEKARATYRIQDAERFPAISATASDTRQRSISSVGTTTSDSKSVQVGFSSYELDVFGRLRNLSDASLQDYLALQETRRSTQISLVAEVATAWLTLAADQQHLALAQDTLKSQQSSYDLLERSHALGGRSGLELAQQQSSVQSARVDVASYATSVQQDRNALELMLGTTLPANLLPDNAAVSNVAQLLDVPAGLPSSVLQQRPDVLSAEHTLQRANANVGAARAAFFPSISLTAQAGIASTSLSGLFKGGSGVWSFAPSLNLPIFNAGSNQASLDSAKAEHEIQVATYEKAVQTAFKEVADALAQRSTLAEQTSAQQALTDATKRSYDLSQALFKAGAQGYLNVLDAQRSFYSAQQDLITLGLSEQSNRISLYKVLGGGWKASS
ncbi:MULTISPECIES: efflux transporter outer membrane subunit [Pseudomonas]|uniref:efflux transporter outer membrane subunit n=1 Tax=Pseudomonas TaxID=286 RepID=UPI00398FBCF7